MILRFWSERGAMKKEGNVKKHSVCEMAPYIMVQH